MDLRFREAPLLSTRVDLSRGHVSRIGCDCTRPLDLGKEQRKQKVLAFVTDTHVKDVDYPTRHWVEIVAVAIDDRAKKFVDRNRVRLVLFRDVQNSLSVDV